MAKIIHLSDLHIGKRVNEFSMIEDQKYILTEILKIIDEEKPDAVIIAGDVYDKSVPSAEAVELFDSFVVQLAKRSLETFIISGNHDSAERLAFGNRLMDNSGIHFSPVYNGYIKPFKVNDKWGSINIFMLPFIKPANVRRFFEDDEINTYDDAMRVAIREMNINQEERNILVAHQFVTGAVRSLSEEISVGGTDNIDASILYDFDYVALGHIHGPQNIESEKIRYCGTPLKYSFSEANHKKSITVVEMEEKGSLKIRTVPLIPKRDMVELKGKYNDLTLKAFYENTTYQDDYVHITLTDEEDIPNAVSRLRVIYHNLMKLDYDNTRTRSKGEIITENNIEMKSPLQLFMDFYQMQNGADITEEQKQVVNDLIEEIWEV